MYVSYRYTYYYFTAKESNNALFLLLLTLQHKVQCSINVNLEEV